MVDQPTAETEAEIREEARRRQQRLAAEQADSSQALTAIKQLLDFILKLIFGDADAPDDEDPSQQPISMGERARAARDFVMSDAAPKFLQYQREHAAEVPKGGIRHINPVAGDAVVTSGKGKRNTGISGASKNHQGIDIDVTTGDTAKIVASADGIVVFAGKMNGYGNTVVIGHADGTKTLYAHMTGANTPKIGAEIGQGEVIGQMGNTTNGRIKNMKVHLHYEQIKDGERITPHIHGQAMGKDIKLAQDGGHDHHDHEVAERAEAPAAKAVPKLAATKPAAPHLPPHVRAAAKAAAAPAAALQHKPAAKPQPDRFAFEEIVDGAVHKAQTVFASAKSAIGAAIGLG